MASIASTTSTSNVSESSNCASSTNPRSSAEVWYSGYSPWTPRGPSDGQIEPGRTELPFVVAVRSEWDGPADAPVAEEHLDDAIDRGVSVSAALVREIGGVAQPGEDESVADPVDGRLVGGEPRQRADGAGDEQQSVGEPSGS